ncbi:MAG TPA: hypothetical protein PLB81_08700 [Deltaproteobacteria bacterium]|nr:hypothetical protein [Deltaproteobacteria bacterium]
MKPIAIEYRITPVDAATEIFNLSFDPHTLDLVNAVPDNPPSWTDLDFHQCHHCPLVPSQTPRCPLALRLVDIVRRFKGLSSFDKTLLTVITEERVISQKTTAQRSISSLIGLISATSGCPHTIFFRPMARFHLPLASEAETIYRASSMYMLAQYFRRNTDKTPEFNLQGLKQIYANTGIVNFTIAQRLRAASDTDSAVNAIVLLDMFVKTVPYAIEESLEGMRHLFAPYFEG